MSDLPIQIWTYTHQEEAIQITPKNYKECAKMANLVITDLHFSTNAHGIDILESFDIKHQTYGVHMGEFIVRDQTKERPHWDIISQERFRSRFTLSDIGSNELKLTLKGTNQ